MQEPFDDPDWIYELKLDGCRCVAYLERGKVTLRNKRNMELLPRFPELGGIHEQVQERCILDGELVVLAKGRPDYPGEKTQTVWCIPDRICTVEYMPNTKDSLRQPVFKGIRDDV